MKKPDTLVVITPAFPEHESASWWVPSQQAMVKALQQAYPQLTIKVLAIIYPYQANSYRWHNISVEAFDGMHHRKLKRLLLWKRVWQSLRRIHKRHSIIGLFSFWSGECAFIAQHFARVHAIKHISWICGQDAKKENRWVPFFRPKSHQLAAMSASLRDRFAQSHGVTPQYLVPNAIDPAVFPTTLTTERDIDIMAAGSFEPLKQYDLFAEIIGTLHYVFPTLKAIHCGQGREKSKVESVIKKLHIEKHLSLLGGMEHTEVLALMQRSKLFLHTSRYEGCSTVCLEALYAGAHVISFCYPFDHPVPHWHVVNTIAEMTEKAAALLHDPATDYSPVLLHEMKDSARSIMELFKPGRFYK
jgi:glycosyltransferase involved in cell wall biosynthesis